MANLTLENISERLHEALKERALSHGRSLSNEVIDCLERAVLGKRCTVSARLARIRSLRAATPGQIDDALIRKARVTGRP